MTKIFTIILFCFIVVAIHAQPYIDIVSLEYVKSPNAGAWRRNNTGDGFNYYNASLNLPLVLKQDSSIILFSPFAERWNIKIDGLNNLPLYVQSLALPISLIKPFLKKWSIFISAIPRWNGNEATVFKNNFQIGGAFLVSYKKRQNLTYKIGLYYNGELSGAYFVPLFGIDWRINRKNNIFGILPGNLVFEHKTNAHFYWGASFNAITNTYAAGVINTGGNPNFLRIEDNQLILFADYYIQKNILLHVEAGHSIFRAFKLGVKDDTIKYYYTTKMDDDLLLKIALNYRIRF